MKKSIEKVLTLPFEDETSISIQLAVVKDLLEYIFDRKAALLPGYFVVNEILKVGFGVDFVMSISCKRLEISK